MPRARRAVLFVVAALVLWSLVAWIAARSLLVRVDLSEADALVVMSGSATYAERTRLAAELFREGRAPRVILTNDGLRGGWSESEQRNPFFVERARAELERAGVPAARIRVVEGTVVGTFAEAGVLREYAGRENLRALLVVTSGYHSRRTWWSLGRAFSGTSIAVGIMPVAPGEETPAPCCWWVTARGWQMVAGEYVKLIYYRLRSGE